MEVEEVKASPFDGKIIGYLDTENPFDLYPKTFTTLLIESEHLTVKRQRELSQAFDVQVYSDLDQSIKDLRNIKSQEEIEKLKSCGARRQMYRNWRVLS